MRPTRFLRALVLAAVFTTPGVTAQAPDESRDPEQINARLDALRSEIREISERLAAQRAEQQAEQDALAKAETRLSEIVRELRQTRDALDRAQRREAELAVRGDALEAEIRTLRDRLHEQLRIAYRLGSESRLRSLLNQRDVALLSRSLAMHGYLGRARLSALDELQARSDELDQVRDEQRLTASRLERLAQRQAAALEDREQALDARRDALAALDASIRSRDRRLNELNASAARLESLLTELAAALADIPPEVAIAPFASLRGALPMPVAGEVVIGFGQQEEEGPAREGWLIGARPGDPVEAVAHGRVAYADWLRGYGMLLILDHGDGFLSLYGRNESLLAEVGDWVSPGQTIAVAGSSGGGRPGLYFQLRRDGRPVNPAAWIAR